MGTAAASIDIARTPDAVWALVGDFGGIGWMPGIDSVVVEGGTRTLSISGMRVVEELRSNDTDERRQSYAIVGGDLPVERHRASISVSPNGTGSRVTWEFEVEPDTLTDTMHATYRQALQALREVLEGGGATTR